MKRLVAFWSGGTNYCNIPFDHMEIVENVIFLYRDTLIAQIDMGFVDLWYVTEAQK